MELLVQKHQEQLMSEMPWVSEYKNRLESLNGWWNKISLIGKINSYNIDTMIFSDMHSTKEKLNELQLTLISNLMLEEVKKVILENSSKAQVAIDILIRNLFERTADVGFLATDDDIRAFLVGGKSPEEIRERLHEYVLKYSVYANIVVTDPQGNIKVQLDSSNGLERTDDLIIQHTLESEEEYVETYRHIDMQPDGRKALVYSCKITETNDPNSNTLGVLCLFFKFEDEMEGIFNNLHVTDSDTILMLTDSNGEVISASSDKVELGTKLRANERPELLSLFNSSYISNMRETKGYQGFEGLGWAGRSLVPVNKAFVSEAGSPNSQKAKPSNGEKSSEQESTSSNQHYPDELKKIHNDSIDVNEDLKLIVLNGIITAARADAKEFVPILEEIKKIGDNTANIFSHSIARLQETVLSSYLMNIKFLAELAVDIMDRNLYERANDCRWWALTSACREKLAKDKLDDEDKSQLTAILQYINELYTVYTNLYLYDKSGTIIAVSNSDENHLIGQQVSNNSGAVEALKISDSQKYTVSPFVATPYYDNKPTYIYNASVTSLNYGDKVIGGIGIVFDSEPQFQSMLEDTLPKDDSGKPVQGCFGLFVDANGMVISSSEFAPVAVGEMINLEENTLLNLEQGESTSLFLTFNNQQYIVGSAASKGYREYKTTGDYTNDIVALIFIPQ